MKGNEIDAVGLVRQIRDAIHEQTKDMSTEDLIGFYHSRAAATKEKLARLRSERKETTEHGT
jgi:hypothetical protein